MNTSAIARFSLTNGLRVILDPHDAHGLVGISVHYDVGFRTEPIDKNGVAHLCEHLLCDGADTALTGAVLEAGGLLNATTQADYTEYYGVLPAEGAESLLRLEADRMATRRVAESALREQVRVVKDEIRANIDGQPFGGFPWMWLGKAAYTLPSHSHNGYGAQRVETLSRADVEQFIADHYAPGSAILTVSGSFYSDHMKRLVEKIFGGIGGSDSRTETDRRIAITQSKSAHSVPAEEPPLPSDRTLVRHDAHAPHPATAVVFRAPADRGLTHELLAAVVLADILADHPLGRLDRMTAARGDISEVGSYLGLFGNPLDGRAPLPFVVEMFHGQELNAPAVLAMVRRALADIAADGVGQEEVTRTAHRIAAQLWRTQDQLMGRTLMLGSIELIHSDAASALSLPRTLLDVTAAEVRAVAAALLDQNAAVLALEVDQ
ncbi:M16 family metallopeptidase [Streptomyces goshikiensis]|uniref:M16 family metallopeptidase n=1 Tax=Streptomyces goshikiensis TaxID=1942 RepID=UPI0016725E93|nr:insulinase family protein [Streptomyces goshikiensis]GHD81391.1 peptidase M16 [Streptomyces goshikiensis]